MDKVRVGKPSHKSAAIGSEGLWRQTRQDKTRVCKNEEGEA